MAKKLRELLSEVEKKLKLVYEFDQDLLKFGILEESNDLKI